MGVPPLDILPGMENHFTAVFDKNGDWWTGSVEELPGANTQGETLEEARENLKEAVSMVLETNRELAERGIVGKTVVKESLLVTT
jgi:predicted RNase H-like HicB family nuclease